MPWKYLRRLVIGVCLAALSPIAVYAQDPLTPLPDWVLVLSRVKLHLKENFERIPNYVCRETVERFEKAPGRARAVKVDTLEFDVAEVEHKELLAKPGADGFEDRELSAYMSVGMLGTGQFSALPLNLFVSGNPRITPHQEASRPAYDFVIPAFQHALTIMAQGARADVGEQGTFWFDPESLDLIRIEDRAVDVPAIVGMSSLGFTVEYARMQMGSSSLLLPRSAEQMVTELRGRELRNQIQFSQCREYGSESTVRFGDTVEPPPVAKKK
jgi:hypothetical protein